MKRGNEGESRLDQAEKAMRDLGVKLVFVPTLAGKRSDEATVLLAENEEKAAELAALAVNAERQRHTLRKVKKPQ